MTTSSPQPRPLSPHLGIYKPQISTVMSILHRATGIGITLGLVLFVIWLLILGSSPDVYTYFTDNIKNIVGQAIIVSVFFLVAAYVLSYLNIIARKARPSSEVLKWFLIFLDIVVALAVTKIARDYMANNYTETFDKICLPIGLVALIGWTWAFFYHFFCGIRHLMWDAGWFLSLKGMHVTGWITIILSALLTLGVWLKIYGLLPSIGTGIIS